MSQMHVPLEQRWPVAQAPVVHVPPQPSLPPHGTPAQLGVQPVQRPPAQVDPLPVHFAQIEPPLPHALAEVPPRHDEPLQHPLHDVGSQTHTPASQCRPAPHSPVMQTPPHPSLAPHAAAHVGVQVPVPHKLGPPPPPHVRPAGHAPQSMRPPQRPLRLPQYPAQSAALLGMHAAPSGSKVPPSPGGVTAPPSVCAS